MVSLDQRLDMPFDGSGNGCVCHHEPDLDMAQLGGPGEICRSDEGFHAIDDDALCVKAGSQSAL